MTIKKIIDRVDKMKPNAVEEEQKLIWIAELDGKIAQNVMLMHPDELYLFAYRHPQDLEKTPLVEFPHDAIYEKWLLAQIDAANEEWDAYANDMEIYNSYYKNYVRWFASTWRPAQGPLGCSHNLYPQYFLTAYGLAVMRGFEGTLDEWLESLIGPKGDKGDAFTYDDFTAEQLEELKVGVFAAEFGVTTYEEVTQAIAQNKAVFARHGTLILPVTMNNAAGVYFSGCSSEGRLYALRLSGSGWKEEGKLLDQVFCAEYGVSTYRDVEFALEQGKACFVKKDDLPAVPLMYHGSTVYVFGGINPSTCTMIDIRVVQGTDEWSFNDSLSLDKVFTAEYGVTDREDILQAVAAGKTCFCRNGAYWLPMTRGEDMPTGIVFSGVINDRIVVWRYLQNRGWDETSYTITNEMPKDGLDGYLPTAQAVQDFVMAQLEAMPNAAEVGY